MKEKHIKNHFALIRPAQQIKNGAVVLGAFASGLMNSFSSLQNVAILTLGWVCLSGSIYILNDLTDFQHDREHPKKSARPLASGKISKKSGWVILALLALATARIFLEFSLEVRITGALYFFINVLYSLYLKNLIIVDLLAVSSGFLLRGLSGIFVVNADPSVWFLLLSVFGSLMLIAGKRSAQIKESATHQNSNRHTISRYSTEFLNHIKMISSTGLIISYVMMTQEKIFETQWQSLILKFSIAPFLSTILLILYFQETEEESDVTNLFYSKAPIAVSVIVWVAFFVTSMVNK